MEESSSRALNWKSWSLRLVDFKLIVTNHIEVCNKQEKKLYMLSLHGNGTTNFLVVFAACRIRVLGILFDVGQYVWLDVRILLAFLRSLGK